MRLLSTTIWLTTLSLVALTGACNSSSDGGGSGGGLNSGVDQQKSVQDVTDEEARAVCEAFQDYAEAKINSDSFQRATCRYAGIITAAILGGEDASDGVLRDACELGYNACVECLENPNMEGCEDMEVIPADEEPAEDSCANSEPPMDCDATVGEVEACAKAQIDDAIAVISSIPSCSELTLDGLEELASLEEPGVPSECDPVADKCPEFLEEDTTQ